MFDRKRGKVYIRIRAGSNFRDKGGLVHGVQRTFPHRSPDSDIALLKLVGPLRYNVKVKSIPLASFPRQDGDSCAVAGWGSDYFYYNTDFKNKPLEERPHTPELHRAAVTFIGTRNCSQTLYQSNSYKLTENMICAGKVGEGGKCEGFFFIKLII